jgi:metallo-beta-lactamase class B
VWPLSQYQLVNKPGHRESYPGIKQDFAHAFATLRSLPCDIFLGAHGSYFDLLPKLKRMPAEGKAVFIDPQGYSELIQDGQDAVEKMVKEQSGGKS